jgi:hypothetical protein
MTINHKFKGWSAWCISLVSFAAGSVTTVFLAYANERSVDHDRVFELLVYHAVPGKVPKLEARFRDATKLFAKHDINVLGYWVATVSPTDNKPFWDSTFIYLVVSPSQEEAKRKWDTFHADPEFQKYLKSEEAEQLIEKVDATYMRPTDFSQTK